MLHDGVCEKPLDGDVRNATSIHGRGGIKEATVGIIAKWCFLRVELCLS